MTKDQLRADPNYPKLVEAYTTIFSYLRSITDDKIEVSNFEGSEDRCARAILETCYSTDYIRRQLNDIVGKVFEVEQSDPIQNVKATYTNGIICQGPIRVNSCCPHHLYPVIYEVYVAYVPSNGIVLGLSKLSRICKLLGRRPVLQEQLASDIANVLCQPMRDQTTRLGYQVEVPTESKFPSIKSEGSAVFVKGLHTCMACRGVESDAKTSVCELRGVFNQPEMEQKFYSMIKNL